MRQYIPINDGWEFIKKSGDEAVNVTIPHTWNAKDGQNGGNNYYRGVCTYRKVIKKTDVKCSSKDRIYLEFQGVNSSATVKVNDVTVCHHDGGYSAFRVDITEQFSEENHIEIAVDNGRNNHVYPQRADFTLYGGIYRDIYLIIVPECHFCLDYHGSPGIMVTPEINGRQATVRVKTFVKGEYDTVRVTIDGIGTLEADKSEIYSGIEEIMNTELTVAEAVFVIDNVHLWNGIKDPYLYRAKAQLIVNGETKDEISAKFGCRTYYIDPGKGFFLNGQSYPLRGVSRHQDRKNAGNALTKEMHEEDMEMILDMGANSLRLAHYQHDQYFYDLCDEKGIVVWAEIPYISLHMPEGRDNTLSQMTELIVQNYNHPSIVCWGLSNETSLTGVTEELLENHRRLNNLAHRLDPTRVTTMANLSTLETESPLLDIPDVMAYNLYFGWYAGKLEDNDKFFDDFHAKYPDKSIGLSEYGADAVYKLQSPNPKKGDYSEQYQCLYHEHMLEMIEKRPFLWSAYVWNMFDFAADAREDAGEPGINHKGLVSFDRKVKKDAFYLYKAWWSDRPFVHLCGSRYADRTEETTQVKVYSNLSRIALYKDGTQLEEKYGRHVFIFEVQIQGEHYLEAKAVENGLSDSIKIRKAEKQNPEYIMDDRSVSNWIDEIEIEVIPGCFSIKDKMGDIEKVPEGRAIIDQMRIIMASRQESRVKDIEFSDNIRKMMERFTVENLLKQAGEVPHETVIMINKKLNKVKKPD